jgi:hypothetical protein
LHLRAAGSASQFCKAAMMPQCVLLDTGIQSTLDIRWAAPE